VWERQRSPSLDTGERQTAGACAEYRLWTHTGAERGLWLEALRGREKKVRILKYPPFAMPSADSIMTRAFLAHSIPART
jgi:hypothetical protein